MRLSLVLIASAEASQQTTRTAHYFGGEDQSQILTRTIRIQDSDGRQASRAGLVLLLVCGDDTSWVHDYAHPATVWSETCEFKLPQASQSFSSDPERLSIQYTRTQDHFRIRATPALSGSRERAGCRGPGCPVRPESGLEHFAVGSLLRLQQAPGLDAHAYVSACAHCPARRRPPWRVPPMLTLRLGTTILFSSWIRC